MTNAREFRLSTYLTLGVACACLGYAEFALFPEVGVFAAAVVGALVVVYRLEARIALLSIPAANRLGGGIGLAVVVWAGYRIVHEYRAGEYAALGWPLFFVALTAPVLLAALPAKLLRREKHTGDYWQLHAAGLGCVVLAGAMSETAVTLLLMAVYAVAGVWSLSLFFLARSTGSLPPIPVRAAPEPGLAIAELPARPVDTGAPRRSRLRTAVLCTAAAAALAAPLYLLTPRSSFGKLEFGNQRIEVGYSPDQMIDLNRNGALQGTKEPAFQVVATENNRPKEDVSPVQRWKGAVLTSYAGGSWRKDTQHPLPTVAPPRKGGPWSPPHLGPGQYELVFSVPAKMRGHFLADPVVWAAGESVPVADLPDEGPPLPWYALSDGSFLRLPGGRNQAAVLKYIQFTCPQADPDLGPALVRERDKTRKGEPLAEIDRGLVTNPVGSVRDYAGDVLARLVAEKQLPAAARARDPVRLWVAEEYHEAVARAFCKHLAEAPELAYTTDLKRHNLTLDPVEEFLFHTRAGHCSLFATALALMLRSQGIPAVMVIGFKGCEHTGGGRYEVRQEQAHAWVEALVSRPPPPGETEPVWHWLSLDPSPMRSADAAADPAGLTFWGRAAALGRGTFDRYLVNYSAQNRERTLAAAADRLTSPAALAALAVVALAVVAAGFVVWRRAARARPAPPPESARWFDRLLAVLAAHGYVPAAGETPREFAATTEEALRKRPATAAVADVPGEWAEAYYRARFGEAPLAEADRSELDVRLGALRQALAAGRGRV
jgi:hypothetical protein